MIEAVRGGLALSQAKAKKGRSLVKPFKIEIIDLNMGKTKDKEKSAGMKGKASKKKVWVMLRSYSGNSMAHIVLYRCGEPVMPTTLMMRPLQ